jgi:hypothetical protein
VVQTNERRHLYTKHRFHVNRLSKQILALNIVLHIFSLLEQKNNLSTNIIALKYHEVHIRTISPVEQLSPMNSVETGGNTLVQYIWEI